MNSTQQTVQNEFRSVLVVSFDLLHSRRWSDNYRSKFAPHNPVVLSAYIQIKTRALNLIERACGQNSAHWREISSLANSDSANDPDSLPWLHGVIEAAQADFTAGLLFDIRAQIQGDLFGDFIDQSEMLLKSGLHIPATSLAGAVLEDTLRKLCEKHKVAPPEKPSIGTLNVTLSKAGVYPMHTQKLVTAYADLRNKADHAEFDKVSERDVEQMVQWLRGFMTNYL